MKNSLCGVDDYDYDDDNCAIQKCRTCLGWNQELRLLVVNVLASKHEWRPSCSVNEQKAASRQFISTFLPSKHFCEIAFMFQLFGWLTRDYGSTSLTGGRRLSGSVSCRALFCYRIRHNSFEPIQLNSRQGNSIQVQLSKCLMDRTDGTTTTKTTTAAAVMAAVTNNGD